MKKETKKLLIKLMFLTSMLIFILTFTNTSFALGAKLKGLGPSGTSSSAEDYGIKSKLSSILGLIQFIGIAVAVGMTIWLGILYFITSSNPANKAETNKKAQSIFLGIVLVLGATGILTLIQNLAEDVTKNVTV